MTSSSAVDSTLRTRLRQQEAVAELGRRALAADGLDEPFRAAVALVADALDVEHVELLELSAGGDGLVRRCATGWDGASGGAVVPAADSVPARALRNGAPVVVDDRRTDDRFPGSDRLDDHGVVGGITVAVGPADDAWGVLGAYATEERAFADHEAEFVGDVAGVLAEAVDDDRTRRELREEASLKDRLVEASPVGVVVTGADGVIDHVNGRAHELLNPEGRDLVGTDLWEAFPEGSDRTFREAYDRAMRDRETVTFEEYFPDPLDAWFEVRASPSETGLSVYVRDVTERKERERELQRYRTIVEAVDDGVYVVDGDGDLRMVNEAYAELTGYDREELVGSSATRVVDEDVVEEVRELDAALRAGDVDRASMEAELRTADGDRRPVEATFAPLDDEAGREWKRVGVVRDVTERKERERELRRTERRFEAIFEDPNILVGLLDTDGTVLDINRTAMEYVEADLEAVTGEPFWETPWWGEGDDVRADAKEWTERAAAGEYVEFEADLVRPGGERYTINGVFRPVTDDDGDVVSVIVSDRDVTERREYERQLAESERRYRTLAEYFPNGLVTLFDHDLCYTLAAGQGFDRIPVEPADLEGESFRDVWDEETADELEPAFQAALAGEEHAVELSYAGREWIVHAVPITDERGDVFAGMTMAQDITERKEYQRRLAESEQRYRTLVENFPNGAVALFDEDLRYTVVGGEMLSATDVSADDVVGQTVRERYPDGVAEQFESHFRAALAGESGEFEVEMHDRHWTAYTLPVRDDRGDIFAGMVMVQDVTERRERERDLRETKLQLEAATEAGAVGTWEWRIPDDEFVAGPSFARTFGVDPAAAREGVSIDQFLSSIHEEDRDRVQAKIDEAVAACGEYEAEYRVRNDDGDLRWVVARGEVECDEAGDPVTFPGAVTDITDRKRAELALQRNRNQLQTLVEILPVGVLVADADGALVEANDTAREIWGVEAFEAADVSEYDRYPARWADSGDPVDPDEWTLARVLRGEEVTEPDVFEIETADGDRRVVMAHGMPVRNDDGEVTRAVATLTDVTERREYQRKLEESNERLEQFAYAASHDLQEPLRMVSSYLKLIERRYADELDQDGREFIEFAVDGADRMRDMIDGLLEYSRIETRGDPFEPVDLDEVVDDARADLRMRIEESDAAIDVEPLPRVRGDADQLRQVFQNLLRNAVEYSGDDPPRVHVSAERAGSEWVVSVSDEGIGVDPDDADRIFEVFQRLHSHEEHPGTGIGLALCRRIVERHGGEIWVESEPGEGSTFSFTLPAEGSSNE